MKKGKGFAPQNSGAYVDMATKLYLPRKGGSPVHMCTYTLPAGEDSGTLPTAPLEPKLITAYPHPGAAGDAFEATLRQIRQAGWEHIDTGNWTTMTVYPDSVARSVHQAKPTMLIRIRKLSPAQRARAIKEFEFQIPEILPVLQIQITDKNDRWPGEAGYEHFDQAHEDYMELILGDLI